MKRLTFIFGTLAIFAVSAFAHFSQQFGNGAFFTKSISKSDYQTVELIANKTVIVEESLKNGKLMESLAWASSSSTACFPATQNSKFNGNHVLFVTEMPTRSILKVTVKPKKSGQNLSIYGYQLGIGKIILPPNMQSCVTCEAEHKWDYPKRGKTQDDSRTIMLNTIGNPYSVVIGVAGANSLTEADFTLEFSLEK